MDQSFVFDCSLENLKRNPVITLLLYVSSFSDWKDMLEKALDTAHTRVSSRLSLHKFFSVFFSRTNKTYQLFDMWYTFYTDWFFIMRRLFWLKRNNVLDYGAATGVQLVLIP